MTEVQRILQPNVLTAIRQALCLTQEEFAAQYGVERNTVARWEMGYHQPVGRKASALLREYHRIRRVNPELLPTPAPKVRAAHAESICPVCGEPTSVCAFGGVNCRVS